MYISANLTPLQNKEANRSSRRKRRKKLSSEGDLFSDDYIVFKHDRDFLIIKGGAVLSAFKTFPMFNHRFFSKVYLFPLISILG